jgi:hypothetical protein
LVFWDVVHIFCEKLGGIKAPSSLRVSIPRLCLVLLAMFNENSETVSDVGVVELDCRQSHQSLERFQKRT